MLVLLLHSYIITTSTTQLGITKMKARNFEKQGFKAQILGIANNYLLLIDNKIYREDVKTIDQCRLMFNLYVARKTNTKLFK